MCVWKWKDTVCNLLERWVILSFSPFEYFLCGGAGRSRLAVWLPWFLIHPYKTFWKTVFRRRTVWCSRSLAEGRKHSKWHFWWQFRVDSHSAGHFNGTCSFLLLSTSLKIIILGLLLLKSNINDRMLFHYCVHSFIHTGLYQEFV